MSTARLVRAVQRLNQVLGRIERRSAQTAAVSVSQMRLLLRLHQHHALVQKNQEGLSPGPRDLGLRVSDLAQREELAISTMTRNLAGLEQRGWVVRHRDPHDRRSTKVQLNTAGLVLAGEIAAVQQGLLHAATRSLHSSDRLERAIACEGLVQAIDEVLERPAQKS